MDIWPEKSTVLPFDHASEMDRYQWLHKDPEFKNFKKRSRMGPSVRTVTWGHVQKIAVKQRKTGMSGIWAIERCNSAGSRHTSKRLQGRRECSANEKPEGQELMHIRTIMTFLGVSWLTCDQNKTGSRPNFRMSLTANSPPGPTIFI